MSKLTILDLSEARRELAAKRITAVARRRGYDLAQMGRLTADFFAHIRSDNEELRIAPLHRLRARCRELARNDHHAVKFLGLLTKNVIGSEGIKLQSKVMLQRGNRPNKSANDAIETAWFDWGEKANCTVTGRFSWIQIQNLILRQVATDGEVLIRKLYRPNNPHNFTLQFINADQLDDQFTQVVGLPNGNMVIMGVELSPDGVPLAYHVWDRPFMDLLGYVPRKRLRIPASEILHLMLPFSLFHNRGVPWMTAAAFQMNMFHGYQEAELVASRVASCQMGIITRQMDVDASYSGEAKPPEQDWTGGQNIEAQAGTFAALAPGESMSMFNPTHPVTAFAEFTSSCLRSIAAALDVSYMSLSGDLTGASYSSARVGLLDERDTWAALQTWLVEELHEPIFASWLEMAFLSSLKNSLPGGDWQAYHADTWHPRSFPWVDPLKDANAGVVELGNGFTTRHRILAEKGQDFQETVDELAEEEKYLEEKGVILPLPTVVGKTVGAGSVGETGASGGAGAAAEGAAAEGAAAGKTGGGGKPNGKANGKAAGGRKRIRFLKNLKGETVGAETIDENEMMLEPERDNGGNHGRIV